MSTGRRMTTSTLIAEVRSLLDEYNTDQVSDTTDILPALNRAQDAAANILARQYEEPLLTSTELVLTPGTDTYDIPEDAFEQRLEKVEMKLNGGIFSDLDRISYRDLSTYEYPINANVPYYYAIVGRKYQVVPSPSSAITLRLWYLKDPEPLVLPQGRITAVDNTDPANPYLIVDSVGEDLTTEIDELNSFINVTDGETGEVKARFQIKAITETRISLRTDLSASRSSVLGKSIDTELDTTTVLPDDLVSTIKGAPVPFLKKPMANFLISYASADIKVNKLGLDAGLLAQQIQMFTEQVERSWVGRERTQRVKRVNRNFGNGMRRNARYLYNPK